MAKIFKIMVLIVLMLVVFTAGMQAEKVQGIEGTKIVLLDSGGKSLPALAKEAARQAGETYFLTGYFFMARSNSQFSGNYISSEGQRTSTITLEGERLQIHHYGNWRTDKEKTRTPVLRQMVYLHKKTGAGSEIKDVSVLNEGFIYRIKDLPLYWFGTVKVADSMTYLQQLFKTHEGRLRKKSMSVIAFHNDPSALDFLYGVAAGDHPVSLRKNAVFWLGAIKDDRSLGYLKKIAAREADQEVRQQVIFAFYLLGSDGADRELIKLAKDEPSSSLRKKAVFWLGQRASKESVKALKEIITSKDVLSVKSSAVFAISQLPKDKAVPMLIDIAETHQSPKIRKKAIFWLGESGDDRAIAFFEKILFKK